MSVQTARRGADASITSAWSAVCAMTLCVGTLIASEFMPVSLLTPIAHDLKMTEGGAGQAIAVSGLFAVLTSLIIARATRGVDRRRVLLALAALMAASGLMVALAPNGATFMIGRALIGVVIGGFWSMSAATVMRLVPRDQVSRAMSLLNGGNALATMIAAPVGSYLGQYVGWRGAFFSVVPLSALTLTWLYAALPALPSEGGSERAGVFRLLGRPLAPSGMLAVATLFMGQFTLFTYLRPFLETVTQVDVGTLSGILLLIGVAGLVGTWLISMLLSKCLAALLVAMPVAMAGIALGLVVLGWSTSATAVLLFGWGLIGTAAPVAWWTWLSRTFPDDAEAGGGLMVAAIQLAITAGASLGGALYDTGGHAAAFLASAAILCASALAAWGAQRDRR